MCQAFGTCNPNQFPQGFFNMFIPSFMPFGPMPIFPSPMQSSAPVVPQPMGLMRGAPLPTEEAQKEYTRFYLNSQKEQILQVKKNLTEFLKLLDDSITTIDNQLSQLAKPETEGKKAVK